MELRRRDGVALTVQGDLVITLWFVPATVERWTWQEALLDEAIAHHGSILWVNLIDTAAAPPDGPARGVIQSFFRSRRRTLRRLCVVPLGNSFWQTVVRSIVRSVWTISGQSKQHVVCGTPEEGIERALELASERTPDLETLRRVIPALFSALESPAEGRDRSISA